MLSRLVITFLPRSKRLLISWLQSPSAVIFGAPQNKVWHCFQRFPIYLPWSEGTGCHDLCFLNVELSANFFTLLFHFHQELFRSSSLFAIRVVSLHIWGYWYFSRQSWIPACASSSPAFLMMYSACKLNKQGDNIQSWRTPFPILNQSIVPCPVLTCFLTCIQVSQETGDVVWHYHLLRIFHSLLWSMQSKALVCSKA